jgi:DNA-binding response OmpR family regulator
MGMTQFQDKLDTVLIVDDEPLETEWLTEYFQARGYKVVQADDLQSALAALETVRYAYIVIDLSIPVIPALQQPLAALGSEFFRYPGLMVARRARTTGHNTYQVIIYSVHDSADVDAYAELILSKYILKGRPRELKHHIESTMKRTPKGWTSTKPVGKSPRRARVVAKSKPPRKRATASQKKKTFYGRYPTFVTAIKKKTAKK